MLCRANVWASADRRTAQNARLLDVATLACRERRGCGWDIAHLRLDLGAVAVQVDRQRGDGGAFRGAAVGLEGRDVGRDGGAGSRVAAQLLEGYGARALGAGFATRRLG